MFQQELNLATLINVIDLQKIQDSFSETLEITLRIFSADGKPFTKISRPNLLCDAILSKIPSAHSLCGNCARAQDITKIKDEVNLKCPFDLDVFVLPIRAVGDRVVAYAVLGPLILKGRKDRQEYKDEAAKAGVDLDKLVDALIEINVFSYTKVHSINKLLKEWLSYIIQTAYHKKRLGEIVPEVIELDPLFSRYYEEKVLNALLNSCALAFDADSGSIMTLDKKTNMLHIKVARKIDADIVNKTKIKLGESIAGVAAATAQTIFLPKDENRNGLADKMKRKYIKSSMIVPFNKGNTHETYGVISLNLVRTSKDFSDKDIALLKELVKMASIALIPLKENNTSLTATSGR